MYINDINRDSYSSRIFILVEFGISSWLRTVGRRADGFVVRESAQQSRCFYLYVSSGRHLWGHLMNITVS